MKKIIITLMLCAFSFNAKALDTSAYDTCYNNAQHDNDVALCMKAQTARVLKAIQEIYQNIGNHPDLKKWSNAENGNFKGIYNHFINYRNRYCSLYKFASKNSFASENFNYERCLLTLTQNHYDLMHSVIINANTSGEEDD